MRSLGTASCGSIVLVLALAACGGGTGNQAGEPSFSTDPTPLIFGPHPGVKVASSSVPEKTGDYRGEANRTWSVLEQAGVKAVAFVTETRVFAPAAQRNPEPSFKRSDLWIDEFVFDLNVRREQYVDKTYVVRQNRRFLYYKPKHVAESGKYPLMIILHGHNVSPEFERSANTLGRMDELAERDGFVVVYANGHQPKGETRNDAFFTNLGVWLGCGTTDIAYFNQIVPELERLGIPIDENRIYMAGTSAGGAAALHAASGLGGMLAGVAAVTPNYSHPAGAKASFRVDGKTEQYDALKCGVSSQVPVSVMVIHSKKDPAFNGPSADATADWYNVHGADIRLEWRQALGIPETILETVQIPNSVIEGNGFMGQETQQVRDTRNSQATIYRYSPAPSGATFQYIELDRAGHGWPTPRAIGDWHGNVETYGLRNQDFDAADVIWAFMKDKTRIR
jgi:poly(3-hydroxybutyrate) depolymerase